MSEVRIEWREAEIGWVEEKMAMADPWRPFREVVEDPFAHARQWKGRTGGKVVGHLLPDVPEEIVHAAGGLPLAVEGAGVPVSHAQAHIPGYTCAHAMGALERGLRGHLDLLDGMVIPYVCDTTRNLFHIWNHRFPEKHNEFLRLPKRLQHPGARDYLRAEFGRLLDAVSRMTGRQGGPGSLKESLALYNRSRARLRRAYRLHRQRPSLWTAERVQLLIAAALRAPREQHLAWMDALPWNEKPPERHQPGVPIYVRGKLWDPPAVLKLLDELGLLVVEDEMVAGYRAIARDAPLDGDPLEALAERFLSTVPYPAYHSHPEEIVRGFLERVQASGACGVLFLNPKFCEAAAFDTPDLQRALEARGISCMVLETASRGVPLGQLRVRLEAFREMLSGEPF